MKSVKRDKSFGDASDPKASKRGEKSKSTLSDSQFGVPKEDGRIEVP